MRQRYLTAYGGITALLVILLSLCLALGVWLGLPNAAHADGEEGASEEVEGGNNDNIDEEDEWNGENAWLIEPYFANWTEGEFDGSVNVISANPRYGAHEMYFRIISYQTVGGNRVLKPYEYAEGVDWGNNKIDRTAFRLSEEDRSIPDCVIDVISEFEAGEYYLFAVVPAGIKQTVNGPIQYTGINTNVEISPLNINEVCTPFKVVKKTAYNGLSVNEWEWGTYDYRTNTINSDITVDGSLKITYSVATYDNKQIDSLTEFTVNDEGMVNELAARVALNNLDAGNYWLIVSTGEHTTDEPFKVAFKVAPYSNAWVTAPSINEWVWGEYKLNVNTVSGYALKNDNGKETKIIIVEDKDELGNVVNVREVEVIDEESRGIVYFGVYEGNDAYSAALEKFTVSEGGLVNERIANELKALPAGEYNLKCWIENGDKNYVDISETVAFTVKQVPNSWNVSPYVLSWKYGDYERELNVIKGEAVLGTKTRYAIYSDEECTQAVKFNGDEWFELDKNGLVPESVANVLDTIDAGTYYLKCLVTNDNPNYAELSETIPFAVLKILNSWVVAPSIISWNEGRFNADDNILSGTAKAGSVKFSVYDEKDKLLYIINKSENGIITSVTNPDGESLHISVLNKLSVGSYKMVAEVESSDNYTTLTTTAYFAVFEDSVALGGIIAAAVTFAVIDLVAASVCIALLIIRRRKVENQFRNMVRKELGRK